MAVPLTRGEQPTLLAPEERLRPASGHVVGRLLRLLADHVLPASFFALVFFAQWLAWAELWRGEGAAAGLDPLAQGWLLLQRGLTMLFVGLVAVLFAIRARPQRRSSLGPALVALAGSGVLSLQLLAPVSHPSPWLSGPGSMLLVTGSLLALASLLALGRCFGVFPEARGLVRTGPYRWVRHPLYLGEIVSGLGALLPTLSPFSAGLFLTFVALQYWRAVNEEAILRETFPEYVEYAKCTWRILPGLH